MKVYHCTIGDISLILLIAVTCDPESHMNQKVLTPISELFLEAGAVLWAIICVGKLVELEMANVSSTPAPPASRFY